MKRTVDGVGNRRCREAFMVNCGVDCGVNCGYFAVFDRARRRVTNGPRSGGRLMRGHVDELVDGRVPFYGRVRCVRDGMLSNC